MMSAYANREAIARATFELFEIERWMVKIVFPKLITRFCACPNMLRKRVMKFPKARRAF
jgi:hypothetical protein